MIAKRKTNSFMSTCLTVGLCTVISTGAAVAVSLVLPVHEEVPAVNVVMSSQDDAVMGESDAPETKVEYDDSKLNIETAGEDVALSMYRNNETRPAVEWFYSRVTGNRTVAVSILKECDHNDIAPSLAFSLAYAESRYNTKATNTNLNNSIDRGLFQLNNRTFTKLTDKDFFDPAVNARHGLAHLRFCMGVAGNTVSALAMYNAGTTKVQNNSTPQRTLSYIGKIMGYRQNIEKLFADEVLRYYEETEDDEDDGNTNDIQTGNISGAVAMQ